MTNDQLAVVAGLYLDGSGQELRSNVFLAIWARLVDRVTLFAPEFGGEIFSDAEQQALRSALGWAATFDLRSVMLTQQEVIELAGGGGKSARQAKTLDHQGSDSADSDSDSDMLFASKRRREKQARRETERALADKARYRSGKYCNKRTAGTTRSIRRFVAVHRWGRVISPASRSPWFPRGRIPFVKFVFPHDAVRYDAV